MKSLLIAAALALGVAPLAAQAGWFSSKPKTGHWSFTVIAKNNGVCARDVSVSWPGMSVLDRFTPVPALVCNRWGHVILSEIPLIDSALSVTWTDTTFVKRSVTMSVKELVKDKTLYGGGLIVQLDDSNLELLVAEPDKSKSKNDTVWPNKPPVVVYKFEPSE